MDHGARRDPFAGTDPVTYLPTFVRPGATAFRVDYVLLEGDGRRFPVEDASVHFADVVPVDGVETYLSDHAALTVQIGPIVW